MSEVEHFVTENDDYVVLMMSWPRSTRKYRKILRCKILDRTGLILDIFANVPKLVMRTQVNLLNMNTCYPD